MMDSYKTTRANERAKQRTEKELRAFLRLTGCTSAKKRRAAFDRGTYIALGLDGVRQELTASQRLVPAVREAVQS